MKDYKFIYKGKSEYVVGQVKDGKLLEYIDIKNIRLGQIFRARVLSYQESMEAYFVDLGLDKNGLLRKKNTHHEIKIGDDIIVEVIKDPKNEKLYEVSTRYTLSNEFLVLTPFSKNKKTINKYEYGYFLRTKGKTLNDEDQKNYYEMLVEEFKSIEKERNFLPTPKLLKDNNLVEKYLQNYNKAIISNIDIPKFDVKKDKSFNPKFISEISLALSNKESREVLVDDVSIYIDQLEALTVIDINSKFKKMNQAKEEFSIETNLQVVEEIARQIKLRDIKKMLIVDFLRINSVNKEILLDKIKQVFNDFEIKYKIMGFSNLDLLEIIIF